MARRVKIGKWSWSSQNTHVNASNLDEFNHMTGLLADQGYEQDVKLDTHDADLVNVKAVVPLLTLTVDNPPDPGSGDIHNNPYKYLNLDIQVVDTDGEAIASVLRPWRMITVYHCPPTRQTHVGQSLPLNADDVARITANGFTATARNWQKGEKEKGVPVELERPSAERMSLNDFVSLEIPADIFDRYEVPNREPRESIIPAQILNRYKSSVKKEG